MQISLLYSLFIILACTLYFVLFFWIFIANFFPYIRERQIASVCFGVNTFSCLLSHKSDLVSTLSQKIYLLLKDIIVKGSKVRNPLRWSFHELLKLRYANI